jgi:electron transport complex protein RnfG
MKDLIKVSLFLAAVCFISSATLAFTYTKTLPIVKQNEVKKYKESLTKVIPGSSSFEDRTIKSSNKSYKISVGKDKSGKTLGFATIVSPVGYAGPIDIMVGISSDGKVNGIIIQNMSETPGLGTKAKTPKFKNQFIGLTVKSMPKVKKDGGNIDAITAATISSRAVCRGVTEALTLYKEHKDQIFSSETTVDNAKSNNKEEAKLPREEMVNRQTDENKGGSK